MLFCFDKALYKISLNKTMVVSYLSATVNLVIFTHYGYFHLGRLEFGNLGSFTTPVVAVEDGTKVWHLVKHDDNQQANRTQKAISEIFLTRLLSTKVYKMGDGGKYSSKDESERGA